MERSFIKQTVEDFTISQILDLHSNVKNKEELDLQKTLQEHNVCLSEFLSIINCRYGIDLNNNDKKKFKNLSIENFIKLIKEKIIKKASNEIDSKVIFDNFVFSGRCKRLTSPYEINIDLTFQCNLRCIFCYSSSTNQHNKSSEMSTDEIFDIIDEFKKLNGAFVLFGGGEPFIRDDFLEIFKYTKSKGLWTYVLTNGSLITEEVAYEYAKYFNPLFDKIQVSLDGATPEINDKQRGVKGAFDSTLRGITNLTSTGKIRPLINTVVTKLNYNDIPNILKLAVKNNAYTYRCLKLQKVGRGSKGILFEKIAINQDEGDKLYEYLSQKRDELMGMIGIATDNAFIFPMATKAIRDKFERRPNTKPNSFSCSAGTTKLAIAPDGGIVPCSYFYDYPEFYLASIKDRSLKDIWEDESIWGLFREPLEVKGKCKKCDYLYACKTGCRLLSYVNCSDMGGPDLGCTYNP